MGEFCFCGAASRVDEWIIIFAYQVISDQRANVFNFMLPAWARVLSSMANHMNGFSYQQILLTRTSHSDSEERLHLKVNYVIGHEMMYVPPKLSYTS